MENLDPGDDPDKFDALADGVVTNLASPDIVALEEIQDNNGATDDGTVAADETLRKLTDAITAAGGPRYEWREIAPGNDQDGGEPGGNIRNVFLFNPDRVSFVDRAGGDATTPSASCGDTAKAALSVSPGRDRTERPGLGGQPQAAGRRVPLPRQARHRDRQPLRLQGRRPGADSRFQPPGAAPRCSATCRPTRCTTSSSSCSRRRRRRTSWCWAT